MNDLMIISQALCITLLLFATALVVHMEGTNAQKDMACFIIASLIQNVAYMFELIANRPGEAEVAIKMQYLGACFIPLFFARFICVYCNRKPPIRLLQIIAVFAIGVMVTAWTSDRHSLFYLDMHYVQGTHHSYFTFKYGIVFWIFVWVCVAIPFAISIAAMVKTFLINTNSKKKQQYIVLSLLAVVPVAALGLRASQKMKEYDLVPPVLGFLLAVVVISVWSRQIYDLSGMAAKALLFEMQDGTIFLDGEHRVLGFNPAAGTVFEGLSDAMVGRAVEEIPNFPVDVLDQEGKHEFVIGDRHFEGHNKHIRDNGQRLLGYVFLVFDITDNIRQMRENALMRERAEEASRAKSAFMATMTHEMRTPMNAIVGLSELIKEESRGRKVYHFACDIKDASQRLLDIFNDVWDISSVEAGNMKLEEKEYSLKAVMLDVQREVNEKIGDKDIFFTEIVNDNLPNGYMGDIKHIRQILTNLLDNAVKFTNKGKITLIMDGEVLDEKNAMLHFIVKDTGIGIAEDDLEKIFSNFEQVDSSITRKEQQGTGLGLSVAKNLAKIMNGTIEVESVYGKGTSFTVNIPQTITDFTRYMEITDDMVADDDEIHMFIAPDCEILVVDDNLINRKVVMGMLKAYQCHVDEAVSGFEALDKVKQKKYNIILMDHMMPDLDGVDTTKFIRSDCGENGNFPAIIALTANALDGVREFFLENGFQDYITKPVDRVEFHNMLLQWIPENMREETEAVEHASEDVSFDELGELFTKGLNVKMALEQHTGTMNEYLDILNLYYLDGSKKINYLRQLIEKEDFNNYRIEVHGLKGASANIGAINLSNEAKALEDAANAGDIPFILENNEPFIENLQELLNAIQEVLSRIEEKNARKNPKTNGRILEGVELLANVKEALEVLEHFKSKECREKVEWMLSCEISDPVRKDLTDIYNQLKVYEDDIAEDLLREMIGRYTQQ